MKKTWTMVAALEAATKAREDWLKQHDADGIHEKVYGLLDENVEKILVGLLGFSPRNYGSERWEIDHCNGRNSDALRHISKAAKEAAVAWVEKNLKNFGPPSKALLDAARREYWREYEAEMRKQVQHRAQERASNDAIRLIAEIAEVAE